MRDALKEIKFQLYIFMLRQLSLSSTLYKNIKITSGYMRSFRFAVFRLFADAIYNYFLINYNLQSNENM